MPTITELRQQLAANSDRRNALTSNYEKNGTLTKEEREEAKTLREKAATLSAEIATMKLQEDDDKAFAVESKALAAELAKPLPRVTQPDSLGGNGVHIEVKQQEGFKSLGQQLQAIAGVTISGRDDNRLRWESLTPATGGAVSNVPSDGGYLIQKDFVTDLMNKTNEESLLWSKVRKIPIGPNSDGLKLTVINETSRAAGSRWGGVQVYWGAEADAATGKKPAFRLMELELKDLIGLAYATDRLLQDASALEAVFMQAFSSEIGFMLDDAVYNGEGGGKTLGILKTPLFTLIFT